MSISQSIVADQLAAYLHHQLSLEELVDWAERQMIEAEFDTDAARDAVARLGVADVRAFGLTWGDCERLLHALGYAAHIQIGTV